MSNVTPTRIIYSDEDAKATTYPYEAIPLAEMTTQKLALAGLSEEQDASTTLYIHLSLIHISEPTRPY